MGHMFPWWAASSRAQDFSGSGGTRFDKVMSDRDAYSPSNDYAGGVVEMWREAGTCLAGTVGSAGYAPAVAVGNCGTSPGAPALISDHKPIGARLRVYAR